MIDLTKLQTKKSFWEEHNFPLTKPYRPLLGVGEELGELFHAHLKSEEGIRGSYEEHQREKKDAIGDMIMYLIHYCNLNDLDLDECVQIAWDEIKQRDWIKYPLDGKTK